MTDLTPHPSAKPAMVALDEQCPRCAAGPVPLYRTDFGDRCLPCVWKIQVDHEREARRSPRVT